MEGPVNSCLLLKQLCIRQFASLWIQSEKNKFSVLYKTRDQSNNCIYVICELSEVESVNCNKCVQVHSFFYREKIAYLN